MTATDTADNTADVRLRQHLAAVQGAAAAVTRDGVALPPEPSGPMPALGLALPPGPAQAGLPLEFQTIGQMMEAVRSAPPPTWLIRSIWPSDAYGILGAEDKAGKTWAVSDLAIAVAAGTPWLNAWQVDETGPVLMFAGEGSERKIARRLLAIGRHHGLGDEAVAALPIRLCMRVPNLTSAEHLELVMAELDANPARLVILDPLYLAAGDTESSQLNKMGAVLGAIQHAAQAAGAALIVAHHWNKSGDGTDRKRFTGAGTAEWGRVLISMSVLKRSTDDSDGTKRSVVDLKLEVIGDEVADDEVTVRRQVWTDDPENLIADMHYEIERTQLDPAERAVGGSEWDAAQAARVDLEHFFNTHPEEVVPSKRRLYERLRECGHQHADRAVIDAAGDLVASGVLQSATGARGATSYRLATAPETES